MKKLFLTLTVLVFVLYGCGDKAKNEHDHNDGTHEHNDEGHHDDHDHEDGNAHDQEEFDAGSDTNTVHHH